MDDLDDVLKDLNAVRREKYDQAIALLREIMDYCDADLKSASGKTYRKVCEYLDGEGQR